MANFETLPWGAFLSRFRWRQGEHMVIVKPTGGGKTTLIGELINKRPPGPASVVLVTKARDKTLSEQQFRASDGWSRVEEWPPPRHKDKIVLWPRFRNGMTIREYQGIQRRVFGNALNSIFGEGGWTVVADETHVLCNDLGLPVEVTYLMQQGRSSGLTFVGGIQRPKFVPVTIYPNSTHAFIGHSTNRDDLQRLTDLGGANAKALQAEAPTLDYYEFLYVPARGKGKVPVRTTVDLSPGRANLRRVV